MDLDRNVLTEPHHAVVRHPSTPIVVVRTAVFGLMIEHGGNRVLPTGNELGSTGLDDGVLKALSLLVFLLSQSFKCLGDSCANIERPSVSHGGCVFG